MTISVIVAVSDNGVIGKDGKIPWKLSTDLARNERIVRYGKCLRFSQSGFPMGEYQIGELRVDDGFPIFMLEESDHKLMDLLDREHVSFEDKADPPNIFIIGGQQIYDEIFKTPELIYRVYLTRVHCEVEGDTFFDRCFPEAEVGNIINWYNTPFIYSKGMQIPKPDGEYELIKQEFIPKSDKDEYDSTFQVWENRAC